ncbi:MAG: AarF/ABC1/UbiB kinase family protein, partial [Halothece sp.]
MNQKLTSSSSSSSIEAGKKTYRWNRENYFPIRRRFDIWVFVLKLLFKLWLEGKKWSYIGGYSEEKKQARRQARAVWIRESLLELGPTFIKVGQLFSTRADIFPAEYVEELSKLQDR